MRTQILQKLICKLGARFKYDRAFLFPVIAAGVAGLVQTVWVAIDYSQFYSRLNTAIVRVEWDPSFYMMHIRISVALVIVLIGLSSRRLIGLCLSAAAVVWLGLEYIAWFVWSAKLKENAGIEAFPQAVPQAFSLYGATPWNAVVLVLIMAVLLWEIWRIATFVKSES